MSMDYRSLRKVMPDIHKNHSTALTKSIRSETEVGRRIFAEIDKDLLRVRMIMN